MAVITLKVNGETHKLEIGDGRVRLVDVLRDRLGLAGTKEGCGVGKCGSCTVIMNGEPVLACTTQAKKADGAEITTIEGLASNGKLHPVQQAFIDAGAVQCGFCTPGFVLRTVCLLKANPNPTDDEIKSALRGNLCRCTGYEAILAAVRLAAGRTA